MVLKKYVPGITHDQLCTVANWNPQLSKDFLLCGCPLKSIYTSRQDVVLAPCVFPSVPLCPLLSVSKLLPTGNKCCATDWHFMACAMPYKPLTLEVGHYKNRMWYYPVSFQLGLLGMRSVFKLCTWPLSKTLLSVSRTIMESCISHFVSSTPLAWDWAGHQCGQHRGGQKLISENVWT